MVATLQDDEPDEEQQNVDEAGHRDMDVDGAAAAPEQEESSVCGTTSLS